MAPKIIASGDTLLSRSRHFGFSTRLSRHQNKIAGDHFCVPLCNDDKQCDSGKDLSYFNFMRDEQKRNRTPSLEYKQGDCLCPFSLVSHPKWWLRDKDVFQIWTMTYFLANRNQDSIGRSLKTVRILLTPCNGSLGQVVK